MSTATPVNRTWIVSELTRLLAAERTMSEDARSRSTAPPDPSLGVVYHEIAEADGRHSGVIETIATRYGHTPDRSTGSGIGAALWRLKDRVVGLGSDPFGQLANDLADKSEFIQRYAAWVHTFEATGDSESSRELAAILAEETSHLDALQQGLNRLTEQRARDTSGDASSSE